MIIFIESLIFQYSQVPTRLRIICIGTRRYSYRDCEFQRTEGGDPESFHILTLLER